jgi:predicted permease
VLGLAFASVLVSGLEQSVEAHFGLWQEVRLDSRAVFAAIALTAAATFAFALAPPGHVLGGQTGRSLRSGTRTLGGGAHRIRKVLLVGQVAMVTTMLFAAGRLVRSYGYLESLDPGFEADDVLTVQLSLEDARFAEARQVRSLFDESLREIGSVPGVAVAAVALTLPYERPLNMPYWVGDTEDSRTTNAVYVTPGFFETLGIPLLAGRNLGRTDRDDTPMVAVVNQAFVEQAFEGGEHLGRSVRMNLGEAREITVVGVVGNVQQAAGWGGGGQPVWETPTVYLSTDQIPGGFFRGVHVWFSPSWVVRAEQPDAELASTVTQALLRASPDMPTARIASLEEIMADAFSGQRFEAAFLLTVALFSLLLAAVGLYGIVAHEVLERRSEMGLRMALGAKPAQAVWSAGSGGVRLTMTGVLLGGALSYGVSGVLRNLVFGVSPADPVVALALFGLMTLLAVSASFVPAGRVGRLDPARVLRDA